MGTLKLAYPLLLSLFFTLVLCTQTENSDEMKENGNWDETSDSYYHIYETPGEEYTKPESDSEYYGYSSDGSSSNTEDSNSKTDVTQDDAESEDNNSKTDVTQDDAESEDNNLNTEDNNSSTDITQDDEESEDNNSNTKDNNSSTDVTQHDEESKNNAEEDSNNESTEEDNKDDKSEIATGNNNSDDEDEEQQFQEEKKKINFVEDDEETYQEKRKFLQNLTYEKYKNKKYTSKFYAFFKFRIKTKTLFQFIKYCYKHKIMPKNHNSVVNKCLKKYIRTEKITQVQNVYKTYNKIIKQSNSKEHGIKKEGEGDENETNEKFKKEKKEITFIEDDGDTYEEKRKFLKNLTFEKCKQTKYIEIFHRYFKFRVRTRILFNFIKYCYRHRKMPKNHNRIVKKCLNNYTKIKNADEIKHIYETYDENVKKENGYKEVEIKNKQDNKHKKHKDDDVDTDDLGNSLAKKEDINI